MSSPFKNVAIIRASGSIGRIILNGLMTSYPQFSITVITRKERQATFPPSVTVRRADISAVSDLAASLAGQDVVISAVDAAALGEQQKFVDAAIRAKVQRLLPYLLPLFGQKKELIDYLKVKESEGLSWTGVASACLFDLGLNNGFLGFNIHDRTPTIWDGGHERFTLTNEEQLVKAIGSVLEHPESTKNQYLHVASVETCQAEIVAALESDTNAKWDITDTTTETEVSEAVKKLGDGNMTGAFTLVRATMYANTPGLHAEYAQENLANGLLGLEMESVQETLKRVVSGAAGALST